MDSVPELIPGAETIKEDAQLKAGINKDRKAKFMRKTGLDAYNSQKLPPFDAYNSQKLPALAPLLSLHLKEKPLHPNSSGYTENVNGIIPKTMPFLRCFLHSMSLGRTKIKERNNGKKNVFSTKNGEIMVEVDDDMPPNWTLGLIPTAEDDGGCIIQENVFLPDHGIEQVVIENHDSQTKSPLVCVAAERHRKEHAGGYTSNYLSKVTLCRRNFAVLAIESLRGPGFVFQESGFFSPTNRHLKPYVDCSKAQIETANTLFNDFVDNTDLDANGVLKLTLLALLNTAEEQMAEEEQSVETVNERPAFPLDVPFRDSNKEKDVPIRDSNKEKKVIQATSASNLKFDFGQVSIPSAGPTTSPSILNRIPTPTFHFGEPGGALLSYNTNNKLACTHRQLRSWVFVVDPDLGIVAPPVAEAPAPAEVATVASVATESQSEVTTPRQASGTSNNPVQISSSTEGALGSIPVDGVASQARGRLDDLVVRPQEEGGTSKKGYGPGGITRAEKVLKVRTLYDP